MSLNRQVMVVSTKLRKRKRSDRHNDRQHCEDMLNIQHIVHNKISPRIPVLPLKYSEVFDLLFEQEKSIAQLASESGLARYQYREVGEQFAAIYHLIEQHYANQK